MKATFLSQSGYAIEGKSAALVFDYYKNNCNGEKCLQNGVVTPEQLARWGRVFVLSSHFHPDHFNPVVLTWRQYADVTYILSEDVLEHNQRLSFPEDVRIVKPGGSFSVGGLRGRAFGSTDEGVSYCVEFEGKTIFHAGDLNLWAWRNDPDEKFIAEAERAFQKEMEIIQAKLARPIDAAFFPVDARMEVEYWEGAYIFARRMKPAMFFPMHFIPPFTMPEQLSAELAQCGIKAAPIVNRGDSFEF